jgi:hypothetical protein
MGAQETFGFRTDATSAHISSLARMVRPLFDAAGHCNRDRLQIEVFNAKRMGITREELNEAISQAWNWPNARISEPPQGGNDVR